MTVEPKRRIAIFKDGVRFWVIPQIQGAIAPLQSALDMFVTYRQPGDRFVFLGSQVGCGGQSAAVIAALTEFRQWLGQQNDGAEDQVIWLRGIQEELMDRFYTLHFAPDPAGVLAWMINSHHFDRLLADFGCAAEAVQNAANLGAAELARFTAGVRQGLRDTPGQMDYFDSCMRAAVTDSGSLLFLHGGLDPARPLSMQTDAFWWGHPDYFRMASPYQGFAKIFTTLNLTQEARIEGAGRLAIDTGCGRGGHLMVSCYDGRGAELFSYDFT